MCHKNKGVMPQKTFSEQVIGYWITEYVWYGESQNILDFVCGCILNIILPIKYAIITLIYSKESDSFWEISLICRVGAKLNFSTLKGNLKLGLGIQTWGHFQELETD